MGHAVRAIFRGELHDRAADDRAVGVLRHFGGLLRGRDAETHRAGDVGHPLRLGDHAADIGGDPAAHPRHPHRGDAVEKAFQEAVQAAVDEKLKGGPAPKKAPSGGGDDLAKQVESLMMGI